MKQFLKIIPGLLLLATASAYASNTQPPSTAVDGFQGTWIKPLESSIPSGAQGDMIRYGKTLLTDTYNTLGGGSDFMPPHSGNNLSCSSCHLDEGTAAYAGPWAVVALVYANPGIYTAREGLNRNREKRINGCLERSMDGVALPEDGNEMKSIIAHFDWLATGMKVANHTLVKGQGFSRMPDMTRAANPEHGKAIYKEQCEACHQEDGAGTWDPDKNIAIYPAIFGGDSFNDSAGMYRLRTGAAFVYSNMPYGRADGSRGAVLGDTRSQLSQADAWDVTAYVMSQPRPLFSGREGDWNNNRGPDGVPNWMRKQLDADYPHLYPRTNYAADYCAPADLSYPSVFPQTQHKYGPWASMTTLQNQIIAAYKAANCPPR